MRFIYQTVILGLSPLALAKFASNTAGDQNWCGYAVEEALTFVDGSYQIPTVAVPANGDANTFYSNSQWVGLDGVGNLCSTGLLQAGTTGYVQSGTASYYAWVEFYPADPIQVNLAVSPGDSIYVSVNATSATGGNVYLENQTTGQSITTPVAAPNNSELCFTTAEWIEEDNGDPQNPYPKVDTFSMTGSASGASGQTYSISDATVSFTGKRNNVLQCTPSRSGNTATFTYDGSG